MGYKIIADSCCYDARIYAKPRGINQMLDKLLSLIKDSGKKTDIKNLKKLLK